LGTNSLHPDSATPAALGYRMPAEWEPHAATWLTWPRPDGISFPGRYEVVPPVLAKLTRLIAEGETVKVTAGDGGLSVNGELIQAA